MSDVAEDFSISIDADGDVAVIEVTGEIDLAVSGELEEAMTPDNLGGHKAVVLDLTGVGFMDSSGVRAMLVGHSALGEAGVAAALVLGPDSPVKRVLDLAEVGDVLPIHADRDAAEAALKAGG